MIVNLSRRDNEERETRPRVIIHQRIYLFLDGIEMPIFDLPTLSVKEPLISKSLLSYHPLNQH